MPAATPPDVLMVFTTLETAEAARRFVRRLVDDHVVACGTLLPDATSVYRWEGAVTEAAEVVVILKTTRDCWDALVEAVNQHHPYRVPELLAVPVAIGLPPYLAWVRAETTGGQA
ncbi:MAG: divalent-cation tolerance protein CutA [Gemmatimonadota bacterium]|nr:divalent-cation tolerance protein CutA [Gemmatimonadota bacterium]